jgi:hypothetical protein
MTLYEHKVIEGNCKHGFFSGKATIWHNRQSLYRLNGCDIGDLSLLCVLCCCSGQVNRKKNTQFVPSLIVNNSQCAIFVT